MASRVLSIEHTTLVSANVATIECVWYFRSQARDSSGLRQRMRELATVRPRFGYERIHILLVREGWRVGRNRVHRLYKLEGLQVRMKVRRRKRISLHRGPTPTATRRGEYWGDGLCT